MKLIIDTQYMENYGAHEWDGEGDCPQGWKYKGGSTYVLQGLTIEQVRFHWDETLTEFACRFDLSDNDYCREYVLDVHLIDDCDKVSDYHEYWESPIMVSIRESGAWECSKRTLDHCAERVTGHECWDQSVTGDRLNYRYIELRAAA